MAVNNRRTPDDFHEPEVGAGHHVAPSKSVVTAVLDAVTAGGNTLLSLLSGLLAAAMILYSGFVLYDTFYTQNAAYSSGLDLLQYKPEIIEEGKTPASGAETLAAVNDEYRAWLTLYDTNIDYPVMQHDNDLYYASHDVYGKTSLTGAIYLAAHNSADLSDSYNLIYGHHMDNGAMFGALDAYWEADYRSGHREGVLVGASGVFDLNVFAVVDTDAYESAIYTVGERMDEVIAFLRDPGASTTVRYFDGDALEGAEKIVALSTCAAANTNGRLVVFATMTRRPMITVTAEGYAGQYDARPHGLESVTPSITAGTTVYYKTAEDGEWTTTKPTRTDAGTTHVWIRVSNDYYGEATAEADITVTRAPVTVTADNAAKTYGSSDPALTASVSGLLDGDTVDYTVSRPGAGTDEAAGTYPGAVVPTGDNEQGNYTVSYVPGDFTIRPAPMTLTATGYEGTYDAQDHGGSVSTNVPGAKLEYSLDGLTWSETPPTVRDVIRTDEGIGSLTVLVRATDPNHVTATGSYTLKVDPAPVTVTANNEGKTYGSSDPNFTATVSGLLDGDTIAYTVSRPGAGTDENAGTYPGAIVPTGEGSQGNYTVTYVPGDFVIRRFPVTVRADDSSKTYGEDDPGFTASVTPNRPDNTPFTVTVTRTNPGQNNAGNYDGVLLPTVADDPGLANYEITYVPGDFVIRRFPVTVRADDSSKIYGEDDPAFTSTVTPNRPDDTPFAVTVTRSNPGQNNTGTYDDVLEPALAGDPGHVNYEITYESGDFTITPEAELPLRVRNYNGLYDAEEHEAYAECNVPGTTIEYFVNGAWTTRRPIIRDVVRTAEGGVGTLTIPVRATNPNYETAETTVTLTVRPFPVTVYADDRRKTYGEDDPAFTSTVTANRPDDTPFNVTVTRADPNENDAGTYSDVLIPTLTDDPGHSNYAITYEPGDFTVDPAPMTLTPNDYTGVYDAREHAGSATPDVTEGTTVEYFVNGAWTTNLPTIRDVVGDGGNVGSLAVPARATNPNYVTAETTVTLTVQPFPVTVRANDGNKTYGEDDPAFTSTVTANRPDDTSFNVTVTRTNPDVNDAGTYPDVLVPSLTDDPGHANYTVTYETGDFTVTPAAELPLTVRNYDGIFDANEHEGYAESDAPGTTIEYFVNGAWTTERPIIRDVLRTEDGGVGTLTIPVRATNPNYEAAEAAVTLRVRPFPVTVKADDSGKTYGEDDPAFTSTVTQNRPDDTPFVVTVTRSNPDENDAGTYPDVLIPTLPDDPGHANYAITYEPGDFEIRRGVMRILPENYEGEYDAREHIATATATVTDGTIIEYFYNGAWTETPPSIRDVVWDGNDAGTVRVPVRATNPAYETATGEVTLRVTPAVITVRARNSVKTFGEDDPAFEADVSGNFDGTELTPTVTRSNPGQNGGGDYPGVLVPSGPDYVGGRNGHNFAVRYIPGDFRIVPDGTLAVAATGHDDVYDTNTYELSYTVNYPEGTTVEFFIDGVPVDTVPPIRDVTAFNVTVRASHPDYGTDEVTVLMRVSPRPVTVKAPSASKLDGTEDPDYNSDAFRERVKITGVIDGFTIAYTISRPGAGTEEFERVDTYENAIVPSGAVSQGNYVVTYEPGTFVIIRDPGGPVTNKTDEGGDDDKKEGGREEILEEINGFRTPLANFINSFNPTIGPATPAWALVNLISLILTVYLLFPLLHLGDKFGRVKLMRNVNIAKEELREAEELFDEQQLEKLRIERQAVIDKARAAGLDEEAAIREAEALGFVEVTEDEFSTAVEYLYYKVKKFLRRFRTGVGLEFIDSAVALIVFMLTEDMRLPMILIDKWTPLMILFLAFCWVTDVRLARYREKVLADEEEEMREQEAAVSAATTG